MTARRDLVAPSLPAAPPSTAIILYRSATVTGKPVSGSSTGWPRAAVPAAALYSSVPAEVWTPFATLVLEAADEATLWAAVQNAQQGGSNRVLLTRLGGGVFGNRDAWIDAAMRRAPVQSTLRLVAEFK